MSLLKRARSVPSSETLMNQLHHHKIPSPNYPDQFHFLFNPPLTNTTVPLPICNSNCSNKSIPFPVHNAGKRTLPPKPFQNQNFTFNPWHLPPVIGSRLPKQVPNRVNLLPPLCDLSQSQTQLPPALANIEDSNIGVEFSAAKLKMRYESVINALYIDLPRQCTTCGKRFKIQKEHSNHMDWHVRQNRIAKQQTKKQKRSRDFFVSSDMWLGGLVALANNEVNVFVKSTERTEVEMKRDEELEVPADENQRACAICYEAFEDYYNHEVEDWLYKGAVYLNAPNNNGSIADRSLLGPIVHVKCRPEKRFEKNLNHSSCLIG